MIVNTFGVKKLHHEKFKCPRCGRIREYNFNRFDYETYPCDGYCSYCDFKFKAIDDISRCEKCDSRVDCFINFAIVTEEKGHYVPPTLSRVRKNNKSR